MCRGTNQFLELLKPNYNDAVKYCRALCARWSADDAEDVLQQALLQAMEAFDSLKDDSKFRSWFFKIITRAFYTAIRKHFWKRFVPIEGQSEMPEMPEIYNRIERNENRILLNKALSKLSAKERAALLLYEVAGFSVEEVMNIQGEKSLSTIKSRLSRARKKMKLLIEKMNTKSAGDINNQSNYLGDLENETIKLVAEIDSRK
ncbi:MAG: RNA polymerase sigma factor [Ignavibacteriae bacterium]|nr:MAG: RNA polymerase sigma factor [Ignavibacteriota bacterium]